jgi:hypothetical protein
MGRQKLEPGFVEVEVGSSVRTVAVLEGGNLA